MTRRQIERDIAKLQARITEVKALAERKVGYSDQVVENVEGNIQRTLQDIFGPDSLEVQSNWGHRIRHRPRGFSSSPQGEFEQGIPRTIELLENLVGRLQEKAADLADEPEEKARTAFEGLDLHPRIAAACVDLYRDGHYANAVEDAAKALINFVKEKSRRHDLDGAPLMQLVFSPNNPVLVFNDLADKTDRDEQQGMMELYTGAVLALRNPRAHKLLEDSPERALEYIGLLSLLARRLDETQRSKSS